MRNVLYRTATRHYVFGSTAFIDAEMFNTLLHIPYAQCWSW